MLKTVILGTIAAIQLVSLGLLIYWYRSTRWRRIVLVIGLIAILAGALRRTVVSAYVFRGGSYPLPGGLQDLIALAVLTLLLLCGIILLHLIFKSLEETTAALAAGESHFRGLVEQLPGVVCRRLNDDAHTLLYASEAIESLTGYPAQDFVEKRRSYAELICPDNRAAFAPVEERIAAGKSYVVQYRLCRGSGDAVWVRERGRGSFDDAGKLLFLNCFISDITEQVQSELLLREQHNLSVALSHSTGLEETLTLCLRTAMTISGMDAGGIYVRDIEDGSIRLACHAGLPEWFVQEAGYYPVDSTNSKIVFQGEPVYTCYGKSILAKDGLGQQEGLKAVGIIPVKHNDTIIACINVSSRSLEQVPLYARTGLETLAGQVGQVIAREQARAATREREANLAALFASIRDMIFVLDEDYRILRANPAAANELGYTEAELAGHFIWTFMPEHTWEDTENGLREMSEGKKNTQDSFLCTRDGREIPVGTSIVAGTWKGHPAYFAVARDISERLRAEEIRLSLERQVQLARRLESMGILAGGVAHDFNNLMTVILGNAELVRDTLGKEDPICRRLDLIMQTTEHASALCRQMMTYSGRGPLVTEILYPNRFFRELQPLLRSVIAEHVWLEMNVGEKIPPIKGDPSQMRQVMLNLVLNASEAVGEAEGTVSVRVSRKTRSACDWKDIFLVPPGDGGEYVVIEVSDTGVGMNEETRKQLFDPFFTTKPTGRGLGMAAVLGIIRAHNGGIAVSSEVGKGSCFRLFLQAVDEVPAEPGQRESAVHALDLEAGDTILFVDDEVPLHDMCRIAGAEEGYNVLTAANGAEAVEQYLQHKEDIRLVVLDMTMPVMDGATAFRELRRIDPGVRVLIASGYSTINHEQEFAGPQLIGTLPKPYSLSDLRKVFREMKKAGGAE